LFSIEDKPYGKSIAEYSERWWRWLMEIPQDINPAIDRTGKFCNVNQNDPNVWFITGVLSGDAHRKCEILLEPGKNISIFFGHGYECSNAEMPILKTDDDLINCAEKEIPKFFDPNLAIVKINGNFVSSISQYNVTSKVFEVNLPKNNIWGVQDGKTKAAAVTYFIFIKELVKGDRIEFEFSSHSPHLGMAIPPHAYTVTYEIIGK
jgi:hypothetical protein